MSNKYNNVLYIGVTNNLVRRVAEHKAKINKGFTYKYNVDELVYFEQYQLMTDAIAREKQLKTWKREWKDALIIKKNPEWKDLSESIGVDEEYIEAVKVHYQGIEAVSEVRHSVLDTESPTKGDSDFRQNDGMVKGDSDFRQNDGMVKGDCGSSPQ